MPASRNAGRKATTFDQHVPDSIGGSLRDGAQVLNGVPVQEAFSCAGTARIRIRFLCTAAGTLACRFLRNNLKDNIEYPTNQPADAAVVANTETVLDIPIHYGEGRAYVQFTPTANGLVEYCDVIQT